MVKKVIFAVGLIVLAILVGKLVQTRLSTNIEIDRLGNTTSISGLKERNVINDISEEWSQSIISIQPNYWVKTVKFSAVERALFNNLFSHRDGDGLVIELDVNRTVYNFLKNTYLNWNDYTPQQKLQACEIIEPYIQDDFPSFDCDNPEHRQILLNRLQNYIENGWQIFQNGIDRGFIDVARSHVTITIPNIAHFDRVQIGQNTIILEYQEIQTISYVDDWVTINHTLFLHQNGTLNNSIEEIEVSSMEGGYKLAANHTGTQVNELNNYTYLVQSTKEIEHYGGSNYIVRFNETSADCYENPFEPCFSTDPKLNFNDICNIEFNYTGDGIYSCTEFDLEEENPLCEVIFNPQCTFAFLDEENKTLEINFSEKHDDDLGLTAIDPSIVFSTNYITALDGTPLAENKFALGYCDTSTGLRRLAMYYTNGTLIVEKNIGLGSFTCPTIDGGIALAPFDENSFAYLVERRGALYYMIYNSTDGSNLTSFITVDNAISTSQAVDIDTFNSSLAALVWFDETDDDSTYAYYDNQGNAVVSATDLDTDAESGSNGVCTATTSDKVLFGWYDSDSDGLGTDALEFSIRYINNTFITSGTIHETLGQNLAQTISCTTINNNSFGITYVRETGFDPNNPVLGKIINTTGNQIANFTVENVGGTSSSISLSNADINSTLWLASMFDDSEASFKYKQYNNLGVNLTDFIYIDSSGNGTNYIDVLARRHAVDINICSGKFIASWTHNSTIANWTSYNYTGDIWNGICPSESSCVYSSGDWEIDCSDNCVISENINIDSGHNVTITGNGYITVEGANITGFNDFLLGDVNGQCTVVAINGGNIF